MNRRCSGLQLILIQSPVTHGVPRRSMKSAQITRILAPRPVQCCSCVVGIIGGKERVASAVSRDVAGRPLPLLRALCCEFCNLSTTTSGGPFAAVRSTFSSCWYAKVLVSHAVSGLFFAVDVSVMIVLDVLRAATKSCSLLLHSVVIECWRRPSTFLDWTRACS